jgi:hypothetical protein
MPVEIKPDMTWNSVFKWKPPEQNTVDFLIKYISDVKKDGLKYRKFGLYVADKNLLKVYSILNILLSVLENTISNSEEVCDSINGQLKGLKFDGKIEP